MPSNPCCFVVLPRHIRTARCPCHNCSVRIKDTGYACGTYGMWHIRYRTGTGNQHDCCPTNPYNPHHSTHAVKHEMIFTSSFVWRESHKPSNRHTHTHPRSYHTCTWCRATNRTAPGHLRAYCMANWQTCLIRMVGADTQPCHGSIQARKLSSTKSNSLSQ